MRIHKVLGKLFLFLMAVVALTTFSSTTSAQVTLPMPVLAPAYWSSADSINMEVSPGSPDLSGLVGGFVLQWKKTGDPNWNSIRREIHPWNVSKIIKISGLDPETEYQFRAYAISCCEIEMTSEKTCTISVYTRDTDPHGGGVTPGTPGYYEDGENWPEGVDELEIGCPESIYEKAELLVILGTPAGDNGLLALVQHLIAAKLNVISSECSSESPADVLIGAADAFICDNGNDLYGSLPYNAVSDLLEALINFNESQDYCDPDPLIKVVPTEVDFGEVAVGVTATESITITNLGVGELVINGFGGTFVGVDVFDLDEVIVPPSLAYMDELVLNVTFAPSSAEEATATLTISSTDPANPEVDVVLVGNRPEENNGGSGTNPPGGIPTDNLTGATPTPTGGGGGGCFISIVD